MKKKKIIMLLIKVIISTILLVYVFSLLDLNKFISILSNFDFRFLPVIITINIIAIGITCLKIQDILESYGFKPTLSFIINSYMVGKFFNIILPGSITGDIVRIQDLRKHDIPSTVAISSLVIDRISGLFFLLVMCLFSLPFSGIYEVNFYLFIFILIFAISGIVIIISMFNAKLYSISRRIITFIRLNFILKYTDKLRDTYTSFIKKGIASIFSLSIYSIVFAMLVILMNYYVFNAIGVDVHILSLFIMIPIIQVATIIPISINGIGIRELAYSTLFVIIGVSVTEAISASLIIFCITIFLGIVGWLFYLKRSFSSGK